MKALTMNVKRLERIASALVAATLGLTASLQAVEIHTSDTEEPEPNKPEIVISYGQPSFDDGSSEAQMAQDRGIEDNAFGGLERLYWENSTDGTWRVFMDSQWLANPEKARVEFEMTNLDSVFFELDFYHWLEYDFASGVWYPPTDTFAVLSADALEEEINKLDVSLRLHTTDTIRLYFDYSFFNREGMSLSTRYGDNFQFQIGGQRARGIIPALYDGEETVHSFDARIESEDYINRMGLRVHFQRRKVDRQHIVERAARQPSANRYATTEEEVEDDFFSLSAYKRTEINDSMYGSVGFLFTRLDGDITGSRIFGSAPEAAYDIDFVNLQFEDRGYLDLDSDRKLKQWLFNGNLVYTPSDTIRWMAGVRLEQLETEVFNSYLDSWSTVNWQVPAFQVEEANMLSSSKKEVLDISGFLEGRYSGFKHILLYSRAEVAFQDGDMDEFWSREEIFPDIRDPRDLLDRATVFDQTVAFWETGVNYYPLAGLKISLEGYLKYRENNYGLDTVVLPPEDYTLYPGFIERQSMHIRDLNGRVHAKILDSLRSVTRVDYQETTIENQAAMLDSVEAAERRRIVFNQSLTWTPSSKVFFSATYNYVEDLTETLASNLTGGFEGIVQDLPNDYWQADVNCYVVLSKKMDVQFGYQYLEMSNFINASPATVPYGTDLEQHHGSIHLILHLSEAARARVGYNFYEREEPSANGLRDYTVNMLNGSLQLIF